MKRFYRDIAALLGGILLSLAYPGVNWSITAWLALVPLMVALWTLPSKKRKRNGFLLGYLFGLGFFVMNLQWLSTVSSLGVWVLAIYLACYPAIWALCVATWMNPWERPYEASMWKNVMRCLGFAAAHGSLWAALECLRGWLLTGFSWNGLGVSMHDQAVMSQSADLFGVAGLSLLMVFVQSVFLQVARRMFHETRAGKKRAHPDFGFAALLVAFAFTYGVWRLASTAKVESFPLRVCLLQLNVPQQAARQLWSAEEIHAAYEEELENAMSAVEQRNQAALEESAKQGVEADLFYPDWLVLPEVALNGRLMSTAEGDFAMWRENEETIEAFRRQGNFTILLGLGELEGQRSGEMISMAEDPDAWNSLAMLPIDAPLQRYQKKHLVMFGEYIPLVDSLPWLKAIYEQQAGATFDGAFRAGTSIEPMQAQARGQTFSVIPSICFEDTVARETQAFVRPEAQVILNVTNDGWFAQSAAAAQHFANAKFRSIELRRPMIRCANTGVSAVVGINGHSQKLVDKAGNHFTRGFLLATVQVPLHGQFSCYQIWGDWPIYGAGLFSLVLRVFLTKRNALAV